VNESFILKTPNFTKDNEVESKNRIKREIEVYEEFETNEVGIAKLYGYCSILGSPFLLM
jgi:hypothetical protein